MDRDPIARPGKRGVVLICGLLPLRRPAPVVAAPAHPRRSDRRLWAGQCQMADCAGISAGTRSTMMAGHPKRALVGDAGKLGTGRNRPLAGNKTGRLSRGPNIGHSNPNHFLLNVMILHYHPGKGPPSPGAVTITTLPSVLQPQPVHPPEPPQPEPP
jgi:hypothetical protein